MLRGTYKSNHKCLYTYTHTYLHTCSYTCILAFTSIHMKISSAVGNNLHAGMTFRAEIDVTVNKLILIDIRTGMDVSSDVNSYLRGCLYVIHVDTHEYIHIYTHEYLHIHIRIYIYIFLYGHPRPLRHADPFKTLRKTSAQPASMLVGFRLIFGCRIRIE